MTNQSHGFEVQKLSQGTQTKWFNQRQSTRQLHIRNNVQIMYNRAFTQTLSMADVTQPYYFVTEAQRALAITVN